MKKPSIERRVELSKLYTETCLKFGLADGNKAKEDEVGKETDTLLRSMNQIDRMFFIGLSCTYAENAGQGSYSPCVDMPPMKGGAK